MCMMHGVSNACEAVVLSMEVSEVGVSGHKGHTKNMQMPERRDDADAK